VDQPLETKPHSSSGAARAPQLPKLAVSHFSSIRDAYRMTLHQAQQHDRELAQVSVMEQKLQFLAKSLQRGWRKDTPPEQKQALEQWAIATTTEAVELVKAVTNRHKLKAQDYLLKSDGIHDSQGRKNPQAAVSRLVQVCQNLSTRLEDISSIDGWNRDDQLTLRRTITNGGEATSQLSEILLKQLVPAISRPLAVLGKNPLAGKRASEEEHALKVAAQAKNFLGQFFVRDVVESYPVQPYIPFREKISALWNDLHSAFLARNKNEALSVTARLVVVQRLLLLQEGLDALKEQFANGMASVSQAIRTTEQLAKALIDHPLPFIDLEPSLLQLLTAASRRVDILAARLESPLGTLSDTQSDPQYSKEVETELLEQAKAYLKELDPRAFLPLIPSSDQTSP
jgi:hypothetical protein